MKIEKYLDYFGSTLAPLQEASFNRMASGHDKGGYVIISACRQKDSLEQDYGRDFTEEEVKIYNRDATVKLHNYLKTHHYSFIKTYGGYKENGADEFTVEASFMVFPHNWNGKETVPWDTFYTDVMEEAGELSQDSITVRPPNEPPFLVATKNIEKDNIHIGDILDRFSPDITYNDLTQEYFTRLRKSDKNNTRRITFLPENYYHAPSGLMGAQARHYQGEILNMDGFRKS